MLPVSFASIKRQKSVKEWVLMLHKPSEKAAQVTLSLEYCFADVLRVFLSSESVNIWSYFPLKQQSLLV